MKVYHENPLTYRSLYQSSILNVRDYRCRIGRGGPAAEEHSYGNGIVLMRHGAFCKHFGRRNVTADVNQAVFFSKGSTYRVSHPADCGDRGAVFDLAPAVLRGAAVYDSRRQSTERRHRASVGVHAPHEDTDRHLLRRQHPEKPSVNPGQEQWRIFLEMAKSWRDTVNRRGGNVTLVHLPEIGVRGNTHFPMSDINNLEIADLLSKFLKEKGLD